MDVALAALARKVPLTSFSTNIITVCLTILSSSGAIASIIHFFYTIAVR
jgi:hypothetical protein